MEQLVSQAKLVAIDLVELHADRSHPNVGGPLSYPPGMAIDVRVDIALPGEQPAQQASFICAVRCAWKTSNDNDESLAAVAIAFRVAYGFQLDEALSNDEARAFGRQVAIHHAWPFLREKVRAVTCELGLPPLLLPLRHLPHGSQSTAQVTSEEEAARSSGRS